jgi:hypothetical protein
VSQYYGPSRSVSGIALLFYLLFTIVSAFIKRSFALTEIKGSIQIKHDFLRVGHVFSIFIDKKRVGIAQTV